MSGPSFDHSFVVKSQEIDRNGHANNVVYVRWVQDAAVAHWLAVMPEELAQSISWAVVRHEIDYKRPAFENDELIARTWVGEVTAATSERFCQIIRPLDKRILANSRTIWCVFDPKTGRPGRIDPRIREFFGGST